VSGKNSRKYEPKWQELACATVTDKSFWLKNGDWLVTKARKAKARMLKVIGSTVAALAARQQHYDSTTAAVRQTARQQQ
jgi:hypothetical protein